MIFNLSLISLILVSITLGKETDIKPKLKDLSSCLFEKSKKLNIVTKEDKEFKNLNFQYNNRNPVEPPGIVVPNTTEDVKFIVNCAKLFNISLVAKGGGHSYEKFSFGRGNQLIVDFRNLNKVRVDEKRKTAIVGSGGLLGNVFHKLDSKGGFAIPGGSCPTVGIGGHTLGGGYGLSSRKHGLLIDNLIEIGIVTADGEHIIANEKQHPDLFWALRGGSLISFGLVTYFKFNLFNPPKKLAVLEYIYEPKYMHSAFDGFQNWAANDPNPSVTAVIAANKNQFEFRAVVQADDKHTNETILNEIKQYFPQANVRKKFQLMSFLEMAVYFANLPISPKDLATIKRTDHPQLYFHSKSGYIDRTLNSSEISKFIKLLQESPSSYKLLLDLQGGAINNLGRQETSFVHRRKSLYSLQIVNENDTQENGDKVEYYADEWYNQLKGVLSDEAYQNYVDGRNFNFKKYYGENLEKLLSIKRKYDPENFFKLEMSTLKPKDKSKNKETDNKDKVKDKDKEREKEKEKEKSNDKPKEKEAAKEKEKEKSKNKDKEKSNDKTKEKEAAKEKPEDKSKNKDKTKEKDNNKNSDKQKNNSDDDKKKEKEKINVKKKN